MTPHEMEIIQLNAQIDSAVGKSHRVAEEVIDLLNTAHKANQRGRTQVVEERLDVALRLLEQLLNKS